MRGAFKANPQRKADRQYEPRDLPALPPCPASLGEEVKQAWADLSRSAYWLMEPDAVTLERAAVCLAALRMGQGDASIEKLLQGYIRLLGLPATERSKVIAPQKKPTNKYADLA